MKTWCAAIRRNGLDYLWIFSRPIPHRELETHKQEIHPRLAQCCLGNAADRRDDD